MQGLANGRPRDGPAYAALRSPDSKQPHPARCISAEEFHGIANLLKSRFKNFQPYNFESFDGQHIMGGKEFFLNDELLKLIDSDKIKILGSPTEERLEIRSCCTHVEYHGERTKKRYMTTTCTAGESDSAPVPCVWWIMCIACGTDSIWLGIWSVCMLYNW